MKIKIVIGEKEIPIGKLNLSCDGCSKNIRKLMEGKEFEKIQIYKSGKHQKQEWYLKVD